MKQINSNLKRLRQQRVLSLTDLARLSGVNRITINRIENGKQKPLPRTIRKLAEALQVEVEDLANATIQNDYGDTRWPIEKP
ncbi:MAG: helix-turn-helix transcriptional regulator [Chloroflexota bacterium]